MVGKTDLKWPEMTVEEEFNPWSVFEIGAFTGPDPLVMLRMLTGSGYTPTSSERVRLVNQLVVGNIMGPMQRFSSEAHGDRPTTWPVSSIRAPAVPLETLKT